MTGFWQFDPGEDLDPTFRTEARVVYDDQYLYVVVRAYDPHPDSIVSLLSRRDVKTASDQIKIMIDAFHDQRTASSSRSIPPGVKRDFAIYSDTREDVTWDGVWDVGDARWTPRDGSRSFASRSASSASTPSTRTTSASASGATSRD